jgi:hypothetical protein
MNDETTRWRLMAGEMATAAHRLILAAESDDADELAEAADAAKRPHLAISNAEMDRMSRLLPAWFNERMANDAWAFGLLLTTQRVLHVETILDVSQAADGSLWLDVRLGKQGSVNALGVTRAGWPPLAHSPTDRDTCSVAVSHIVCAVELADT